MTWLSNTSLTPVGEKLVREFLPLIPDVSIPRLAHISYGRGFLWIKWKLIKDVPVPYFDEVSRLLEAFAKSRGIRWRVEFTKYDTQEWETKMQAEREALLKQEIFDPDCPEALAAFAKCE